ncbi:acyloxyacyl hydrolase-like isoform X1 [Biomphalaria glabrata]|uniref:Acyloxyacyl hydrolase-like isoform X1 n=1 Tax=Biomphalaria glabrata TaxID=6526 RepID=A0A9W3AZ53_BIOGL|nr:acyloxyacyl hydrolase-like isoform X1 [Biomphalaria glabrata]XP_055892495.1 acyloxyacyl hydrolase-like isoform X1 [Biomphalaria glabrata]XP_055892496.1 acyloxyacyl hydrolase-like isoform X1 [Biomphalaria glabrata]
MSRAIILYSLFIVFLNIGRSEEKANGGMNCLDCNIVVAIVQQYSELNNISVINTLDTFCNFLPEELSVFCHKALAILGPLLISLISSHQDPNVICHALNFCYTEPGQPTCRGISPPTFTEMTDEEFLIRVSSARHLVKHLLQKQSLLRPGLGFDICSLPGIREICELLQRINNLETPAVDLDRDGFSSIFSLRGSAWRGKDCNDTDLYVHPGAIPVDGDAERDSNCNGIKGVNPDTGKTYEEELCADSQPRGVAVLGDSISAHFHLPVQWFDPKLINKRSFLSVWTVIQNQGDWPMMSGSTGYGKNVWPDVISGPIDSIYLKLRARNRCNHRDYQNIAVNGENSFKLKKLVKTLSRNAASDRPLVVLYALAGSDVCSGPDHRMTSPEDMYNNTLATLDNLATVLPNNSHVIIFGLADGSWIHENMASRVHPLTSYWGTFTYSKFYDFINCLDILSCLGWLTNNQTTREITLQRAKELSSVLQKVVDTNKGRYSNFKLHFVDDPLSKEYKQWTKLGGEGWELIEAVDSLHSSQIGQAFGSNVTWGTLMSLDPEIFGPVNPNNDKIVSLFGDQGGY